MQIDQYFTSLPYVFSNFFRKKLTQIDGYFDAICTHIAQILNGERKNALCEWWLEYIEKMADDYLVSKGFSFSLLPELESCFSVITPEQRDLLGKNLDLLKTIMHSQSDDLPRFVEETSHHVCDFTLLFSRFILIGFI